MKRLLAKKKFENVFFTYFFAYWKICHSRVFVFGAVPAVPAVPVPAVLCLVQLLLRALTKALSAFLLLLPFLCTLVTI